MNCFCWLGIKLEVLGIIGKGILLLLLVVVIKFVLVVVFVGLRNGKIFLNGRKGKFGMVGKLFEIFFCDKVFDMVEIGCWVVVEDFGVLLYDEFVEFCDVDDRVWGMVIIGVEIWGIVVKVFVFKLVGSFVGIWFV